MRSQATDHDPEQVALVAARLRLLGINTRPTPVALRDSDYTAIPARIAPPIAKSAIAQNGG